MKRQDKENFIENRHVSPITTSSRPRVPFTRVSANGRNIEPHSLSQSIRAFKENHSAKEKQQLLALNNHEQNSQQSTHTASQQSTIAASLGTNSSVFSGVSLQKNLEQSLKRASMFAKQSAMFKILKENVPNLKCLEHDGKPQHLTLFCATCSQIICADCLKEAHIRNDSLRFDSFQSSPSCALSAHADHKLLNVDQFMEHPVLAFLYEEKLIGDVVCQSSSLLGKIKDQTSKQKSVFSSYLQSIVQWMTRQTNSLMSEFSSSLDASVTQIEQSINQLQNISQIFKNEWDNWISSSNFASKTDVESLCSQFLSSSDNPTTLMKQNYSRLNQQLHKIPQLNIPALKDVYLRVCDSFRFSCDFLLSSQSAKHFPGEVDAIQQALQSSRNTILPTGSLSNNLSISQLTSLVNEQTRFLGVSSDRRTAHLLCSQEQKILTSLSRQSDIVQLLSLKDKKNIAIIFASSLEFISLTSARSCSVVHNIAPVGVCELPGQRILVADKDNSSLLVFSIEDVKQPKRLGCHAITLPPSSIDFILLPSNLTFNNSAGDHEVLAVAVNPKDLQTSHMHITLGQPQQQQQPLHLKPQVQIWDASTMTAVKAFTSPDITRGIKLVKFISKEKIAVLTNDSRLIVWEFLGVTSIPPFASIDLLAGITSSNRSLDVQVQGLEVIDEGRLIFSFNESLYLITLADQRVTAVINADDNDDQKKEYKEGLVSSHFVSLGSDRNDVVFTCLLAVGSTFNGSKELIAVRRDKDNNSIIEAFQM